MTLDLAMISWMRYQKQGQQKKNRHIRLRENVQLLTRCSAHTCGPSTLGGSGGWTTGAQELKTSLGNKEIPQLKIHKISRVWSLCLWSQLLGTAEGGGWLEPGKLRLKWVEIVQLHSSLSNRAKPCL